MCCIMKHTNTLHMQCCILLKIQNSDLTTSNIVPDSPDHTSFFSLRWAFWSHIPWGWRPTKLTGYLWLSLGLIWAAIWAPYPEKSISPSDLWEGWLLCPSRDHLRPFSLTDRRQRSTYSRNAVSLQNWIQLPRSATGHSVPCGYRKGNRMKASSSFLS